MAYKTRRTRASRFADAVAQFPVEGAVPDRLWAALLVWEMTGLDEDREAVFEAAGVADESSDYTQSQPRWS